MTQGCQKYHQSQDINTTKGRKGFRLLEDIWARLMGTLLQVDFGAQRKSQLLETHVCNRSRRHRITHKKATPQEF
jgi:hypothetical protein